MKHQHRIAALTVTCALAAAAACGDETSDTTSGTTSGQTTGTTSGSAQGGSGGSQGGSSDGGAGETGCAQNPQLCPPEWECCQGVPYPDEGQCYKMCEFKSDRAIKHDVQPVDGDEVLERLAAVPIARWRYDERPDEVHVGPMAQDFRAAFGLGDSDRHIAAVDANGVTMAAIQALHRRVVALESQSETRNRENTALRAEIASLHAAIELCGR